MQMNAINILVTMAEITNAHTSTGAYVEEIGIS